MQQKERRQHQVLQELIMTELADATAEKTPAPATEFKEKKFGLHPNEVRPRPPPPRNLPNSSDPQHPLNPAPSLPPSHAARSVMWVAPVVGL